MKVLVTGGAGFIASHICDRLIAIGHQVIVVDNMSSGKWENLNSKVVFYNVDICDPGLASVFEQEKPRVVIHHAAQVNVNRSLQNPARDAYVNTVGSINLFQNSFRFKVEKIIYASSAAVYGEPVYLGMDEKHPANPLSFYGISKLAPEYYLHAYASLYKFKYTILRYSNVYGPRQGTEQEGGVISIFMNNFAGHEESIVFGDGTATRDFIYVADVVDANIKCLELADGDTVNISTNQQTSILDLYYQIKLLFESRLEPVFTEKRLGDIQHSYLVNSRARQILKWEPRVSLPTGLKLTALYYNDGKNSPLDAQCFRGCHLASQHHS